jgi:CheY-like chemotaxis protein
MNREKTKTILLVEDEAIIALAEEKILSRHDFTVITAYSGEEAVETFAKSPAIDLVLMDINLGSGMDGTRAAEFILRHREIPLIFLSSHTEREVVEKTEGITSYGYIVKNSGEVVLATGIPRRTSPRAGGGRRPRLRWTAPELERLKSFTFRPDPNATRGRS